MEPPSTLMCDLRPYQKQALFWMAEAEKGVGVDEAAKTLHPCWAEYRVCDQYVFSLFIIKIKINFLQLIVCLNAIAGGYHHQSM